MLTSEQKAINRKKSLEKYHQSEKYKNTIAKYQQGTKYKEYKKEYNKRRYFEILNLA